MLHDRWLARLEPDGVAVLLLLALAADRRGASFFSRFRMADALGIDVRRVDRALERLLKLELVDLRPWRTGMRDGVWQLLPVEKQGGSRAGRIMTIAEVLRSFGLEPPAPSAASGAE